MVYRNKEGYADPTAGAAIHEAEPKAKKKEYNPEVTNLVSVLKQMIDIAGYEMVGRIVLRDKDTRKEEYRKVPCLIKKESDTIKDKLSLIFTNATARQLTDWEKVQQAKELKEILTEYKKALQEENKDKPKEEREKMGRIRDIVAQMPYGCGCLRSVLNR